MNTWGGTQGEAVVGPCVFSLPFQLFWMTAALKCLVLVLKTVDLFLTSGCSFCKIRLGSREIKLCNLVPRSMGKLSGGCPCLWSSLWDMNWLSLCSWLSPLLRYAAAWAAWVTYVQSSVHRTIANCMRKPIHSWLFSYVAVLFSFKKNVAVWSTA